MSDADRPRSENWRDPRRLMTVLQMVTTLAAGGCSIYLFLAFGKTERELSQQLARLDVDRAQHEVEVMTSPRLVPQQEIAIEDLGPVGFSGNEHVFYVSYRYRIANTGTRKNEVTYVIVHSYHAPIAFPAKGTILDVNDFSETGDVHWKALRAKGYYYAPAWKDTLKFKSPRGKVAFLRGGGGTAELHSGEDSEGGVDMFITADPMDLVGFVTQIGLNGGQTPDDRWRLTNWEPLMTKEPPQFERYGARE